jgi:predicted alpha/beta hydrolase
VRYDWPALLASVRTEAGTAPIVLLGHSMGGHLSALHLGRNAGNDSQVAGLVIVASGSTHFRGWPFPQSLGLLFATQLVALVSKTLGYYPGARFGFGGLQARQEMLDWARTARNGRYQLKGAEVDDEAALARVTTPTWAFTFAGDRYAPPGSAASLVGKLKSARVSMVHLGSTDLPRECLHHFAFRTRAGGRSDPSRNGF